jgi:hypothetical protein
LLYSTTTKHFTFYIKLIYHMLFILILFYYVQLDTLSHYTIVFLAHFWDKYDKCF